MSDLSTLHREVDGSRPWYREPWPWLLMAGPVTAVIAGFVTLWLAIKSDDGLVADDYYKQGLAINQVLHRDRTAAERKYAATILFNFDNQRLRVMLRSGEGAALPAQLRLKVVHPTRPGADQFVELSAGGAGLFDGAIKRLGAGRWLLILEDTQQTWRLTGEMRVPDEEEVVLRPRET
jgi:uncharacterized protein